MLSGGKWIIIDAVVNLTLVGMLIITPPCHSNQPNWPKSWFPVQYQDIIKLLLSENKLYILNSTYNFYALKNLQFRFQEKNLNLNWDSNPGSGSNFSLEI